MSSMTMSRHGFPAPSRSPMATENPTACPIFVASMAPVLNGVALMWHFGDGGPDCGAQNASENGKYVPTCTGNPGISSGPWLPEPASIACNNPSDVATTISSLPSPSTSVIFGDDSPDAP